MLDAEGTWIRFEVIIDQRPFVIITNDLDVLEQWWGGMLDGMRHGFGDACLRTGVPVFKTPHA